MLLLGGAVTAPLPARAQQKAMPVIGYLSRGALRPEFTAFGRVPPRTERDRLCRGTKLGDRIPLGGGRYDRLPALAADLVGRKVDVIVTSGGPCGTGGEKRDLDDPDRLRRRRRPGRSRAWSPVSPGRAATSRASATSPPS